MRQPPGRDGFVANLRLDLGQESGVGGVVIALFVGVGVGAGCGGKVVGSLPGSDAGFEHFAVEHSMRSGTTGRSLTEIGSCRLPRILAIAKSYQTRTMVSARWA